MAVIKIASLTMLWFCSTRVLMWPALFMILASIAAEISIVFNDSMMPRLVPASEVGRISNTAWGLGYLGGMIALIFVVGFLAGDLKSGKTLFGLTPLSASMPISAKTPA